MKNIIICEKCICTKLNNKINVKCINCIDGNDITINCDSCRCIDVKDKKEIFLKQNNNNIYISCTEYDEDF